MRESDLKALLRRQPCPRLRLHLTGGEVFDIDDPDLVVLSRSTIELLLPPEDRKTREAVISLLHIVWVEVISSDP